MCHADLDQDVGLLDHFAQVPVEPRAVARRWQRFEIQTAGSGSGVAACLKVSTRPTPRRTIYCARNFRGHVIKRAPRMDGVRPLRTLVVGGPEVSVHAAAFSRPIRKLSASEGVAGAVPELSVDETGGSKKSSGHYIVSKSVLLTLYT